METTKTKKLAGLRRCFWFFPETEECCMETGFALIWCCKHSAQSSDELRSTNVTLAQPKRSVQQTNRNNYNKVLKVPSTFPTQNFQNFWGCFNFYHQRWNAQSKWKKKKSIRLKIFNIDELGFTLTISQCHYRQNWAEIQIISLWRWLSIKSDELRSCNCNK